MKTNLKQLALAVVLAGLGSLSLPPLLAVNMPSGSTVDWDFSNANPTTASSLGANGGVATVTSGAFASGWLANNDVLGGAQGVWDLGSNGVITLTNPAGLAGAADQNRVFTLKVVEWNDGGIYNDSVNISIPGATLVSSAKLTTQLTKQNATASIGGWVINETKWSVAAGTSVTSAVITGSANGSLVDQLTIQSSAVIGDTSPQLSIKLVGSNAVVSWSASLSGVTLESSANLSDSASWTPVTTPVNVLGNVNSVTVEANDSARFYRLK